MPEQAPTPASFEVAASGSVRHLLELDSQVLLTDDAALAGLARQLKAPAPPESPRLLLLHEGETPSTPEYTMIGTDVPRVESETDMVVHVPYRDYLATEHITDGIALAMLKHRRAVQRHRGNRIGGGIFLFGTAVSGASGWNGIGWAEKIGYGVAATGIGIVAVVNNRGNPKVPDLSGMAPPIYVTRRPQSEAPA